MKNQNSLIFLHIPKAAGVTLGNIVRRQYGHDVVYRIPYPRQGTRPIEVFKNLSAVEKEKIRVLEGHIPYGLHQYFSRPVTYITMLRDPVERMISLYYFILSRPDNPLHNVIVSQNMSLKDFICSGMISDLDNGQVRILSGIEEVGIIPPSSFLTDKYLKIAKRNIVEKFLLVGITERFDESLILLKKLLNWGDIRYFRKNVTPDRPSSQEVTKEVLYLIEERNALDMELYKYAVDRFLEIVDQEYAFEEDLALFKRQNQRYQRRQRLLKRVDAVKSWIVPNLEKVSEFALNRNRNS